jgi:allantoicase
MGEKDESVPVESAFFLDTKFKEAGKNNLILKVYPESDHRLNGNGISHRDEFFADLSRLLQRTHNIAVKRDVPKAAHPLLY